VPTFAAEMTVSTSSNAGGNVYDKYATRNPIERRMVGGFIERVRELTAISGAHEVHEVGCGEGELSLALARDGLDIRGSDIAADVVAEARRRATAAGLEVDYRTAPIEALAPPGDAAQLVLCCEVLEHLPDPHAGLAKIASLAQPWLLVSVPREPLWRALNLARGKYAGELGNTPGHLNHWSRRGFLEFVGERIEIVEARSPLPWTMVLARVRS
jgi:2-polyprenyl-3-methyl-5-hydroxy-6-metoxy-1,4-benzoquinol methylase